MIECHADINRAETIMPLSRELRDERQIIVNYLKVMNIIALDSNGGFHFIGTAAVSNKEIYREAFDNF